MHRRRLAPGHLVAALAVSVALLAAPVPARAAEVWSGRTFTFIKADFADWTLPANQDRITSVVWITRADTRGIFNIHNEALYNGFGPSDTEWATGNAVDHASLTFQQWVTWAASSPPTTVGVNAVVHLISEDIYVDIRFDSWTAGLAGGGFSYTRAERPTTSVPPGAAAFALRGFLGNPVTAGSHLEFSLPDGVPARLEVFDVAGRLLARREVGAMGAGVHRVAVPELRSAPPGIVFARLVRGGRSLIARGTHLR